MIHELIHARSTTHAARLFRISTRDGGIQQTILGRPGAPSPHVCIIVSPPDYFYSTRYPRSRSLSTYRCLWRVIRKKVT